MKVVIKTNHSMTVGLWLSDVEKQKIIDIIKDKAFSASIILNNGMELNFRKSKQVDELSVISNASKNYRKVFDGEIDIKHLYNQLVNGGKQLC